MGKKRYIATLLAIFMLGGAASFGCDSKDDTSKNDSLSGNSTMGGASTDDGTNDDLVASEGLEYLLHPDGTVYAVAGIGTCEDTDLVIPAVHEGLPVTTIWDSAFSGCSTITSVVISNGVTEILGGSFKQCKNLKSVVIPDSVKKLSGWTFEGCSGLTDIVLSNSLTSVSGYLFYECTSLESIVIPEGVTDIGVDAFWGCTNLKNVSLPDSIENIHGGAFNACPSLQYNEYEKAKYLGNEKQRCLVLMEIGDKEIVEFENIEGVRAIYSFVFQGCSKLERITLSSSVKHIGYGAFYGCGSLKSVAISNSITYIDYEAFYGCGALTKLSFDGTAAEWNAMEKNSGWNNNASITEIVCNDGTVTL